MQPTFTPQPPRSPSHTPTPKPSPLLALVALGIVSRLRPAWISADLQDAARQEQVRPERLSRLITGAIAVFEPALALLTRRGRPPRTRKHDDAGAELDLTRELLAIATALLARAKLRRDDVRALVVGAWRRLAARTGMTERRFCEALALPPRTLRSWLGRPAAPPVGPVAAPPATPPPPKPRPRRRRRFGFGFTLPGTQVAADTTDLEVLGVPLKLVAAQDVGGRDASLFDAVLVDDRESAGLVVEAFTKALAGKEGAQAITDQGTPYLAQKTREALSRLGVEHAPQKEGDPCGKSTIERAFGTIKSIGNTIFAALNRVAIALPVLQDTALAQATATVVLTALLRAYQHGARAARTADEARGGIDSSTLARLAAEARQNARSEDHSRRLMLSGIHSLYALPGSAPDFINAFARYPISVLRDAERAFQSQVHRDDIRDRKSYFGAIVRKAYEEHRLATLREERHRQDAARLARDLERQSSQLATWNENPATWLRAALDMLAIQWSPHAGALLWGGHGLGLGWATAALRRLFLTHDPNVANDLVAGVLHPFRIASLDRLGPDGVAAVVALVERRRADLATLEPKRDLAAPAPPRILLPIGPKARPPPSARLPN